LRNKCGKPKPHWASPSGTGSGTLSIKIGSGDSVDVSDHHGASLTDIAKAINSSKAGVTASVINDGTAKHLVITAKDSGASNTISITGSTGWKVSSARVRPARTPIAGFRNRPPTSASVDVNGLTSPAQTNTGWRCPPDDQFAQDQFGRHQINVTRTIRAALRQP
jgi:flagellar hook-associated protein 2